MWFVYKDVRIEFDEDMGFKHPNTGQWVEKPSDCLRGWIETDVAKRRQWVVLVERIGQLMEAVERHKLGATEEIVFEDEP